MVDWQAEGAALLLWRVAHGQLRALTPPRNLRPRA
eukprot:COSAG01_NODE_53398_length_339_cov_1.266667_1_plen_34_part_01